MIRFKVIIILYPAVFLVMTQSSQAASGPTFGVRPTPSWVSAAPVDTPASMTDDGAGGIFYLLEDQQQRVGGSSRERYYHETYRVTSQAGLEAGSQIEPEFDPTYEELIFHRISIRRGDRIIDALKPREIKLIQPETSLD